LEWREETKRIRLSIGKDAATARARRQQKEGELNAKNNSIALVPKSGNNTPEVACDDGRGLLEETKLTKKPKTLAAYATSLNYFTDSCPGSCKNVRE